MPCPRPLPAHGATLLIIVRALSSGIICQQSIAARYDEVSVHIAGAIAARPFRAESLVCGVTVSQM